MARIQNLSFKFYMALRSSTTLEEQAKETTQVPSGKGKPLWKRKQDQWKRNQRSGRLYRDIRTRVMHIDVQETMERRAKEQPTEGVGAKTIAAITANLSAHFVRAVTAIEKATKTTLLNLNKDYKRTYLQAAALAHPDLHTAADPAERALYTKLMSDLNRARDLLIENKLW